MIRVRVELISAINGEITLLGETIIANDGTERDPEKGNYIFGIRLKRYLGWIGPITENTSRSGRIIGHPRKADVIWKLVLRCLKAAYPEVK